MPAIMTLQGPRVGPIVTPRSTTLLGVADTLSAHPWMIIGGLILGGYLYHVRLGDRILGKPGSPGLIWGERHADHSRTKNLTGKRGRKR